MKKAHRLYLPKKLGDGRCLSLGAEEVHRLRTVLRCREGHPLEVFNAQDGAWAAEIVSLKRHEGQLMCHQRLRQPQDAPRPHVDLFFSPLKAAPESFLVEKATELGVQNLYPTIFARTQTANVDPNRLQRIARGACEQCERLDMPVVHDSALIAHHLEHATHASAMLFYGDERRQATKLSAPSEHIASCDRIGIIIGPEGGFTSAEFARFSRLANCYGVTLAPTVLRAETAAIAALAQIQLIK